VIESLAPPLGEGLTYTMRNLAACSVSLLLVVAGCTSDASSGSDADATTTAVVVVTTTDAGATTTAAVTATTTAPVAPATMPATPAPTAPPTTTRCREVGSLYDPTGTAVIDVRVGDCGVGVQEVQAYLNNKLGHRLVEDGQFGPATETAVRDFQLLVGLAVTGIVDNVTFSALADDGT